MPFQRNRGVMHLFAGDPTTADGAGMTYLGLTKGDVVFSPNINIGSGKADQHGLTSLVISVKDVGATPVLTAPLLDEELAKLAVIVPGGGLLTDNGKSAFGFSSGPTILGLDGCFTLAAIPIDEIAEGTNGIDAPNAIWLPWCFVPNVGDFISNLGDGEDNLQPHTVEFHSAYHATDPDDTVIEEVIRRGFIGTPNGSPTLTGDWSLPAATS